MLGYEADADRLSGLRIGETRVDRRQADVPERFAREEGMSGRRRLRHRHEPLVGQHRLDNLAGAPTAGHDHLVRLFGCHQPRGAEVGQHGLACRVAVEAAVFLRRVGVDLRVEGEDLERSEPVPRADFVIVEIVRRRDLHAPGAECLVDGGVGNDRNPAPGERQLDFLADESRVALIIGIHRDRDIAQHCFRPGRRDREISGLVDQRIANLPQRAVLFLLLDLEIGHRGAQHGVPVDKPLAAIDEAIIVEAHESLEHRVGQPLVHGEALARPVGRRAEPPHLVGDRRAGFLLPFPDSFDECVTAQLATR